MKRFLQFLSPILIVVLLLLGCGTDDNNGQLNQNKAENNESSVTENKESSVHITISENDGEEVLTEEDVAIEDGDLLLDVLKENFDIEEEGGFVTSIDGAKQDEAEGKYWLYDVNGEMAEVGANELELSPGDDVVFDLQAVE